MIFIGLRWSRHAVSHERANVLGIYQRKEAPRKRNLLLGVGVASLTQKAPDDGEARSISADANHQNIDLRVSELLVGPVDTHHKLRFLRQKPQKQPPGDERSRRRNRP